MKGKPIEPGCLAMVVPGGAFSDNDGLVVRVLHWVERGHQDPSARLIVSASCWMVQTMSRPMKIVSVEGNTLWVQRRGYTPRRLIRIDGDPDLAVDTDTAKPKEAPTKEDVF
jgi:hypothetical protein